MQIKSTLKLFLSAILLTLPIVVVADTVDLSYAEEAGRAAGVFRHDELNFQLDLAKTSYVVVDFSEQMPDASFAAMRFDPLVFTMTIVEDLGTEMSVEQYAEIVTTASLANLVDGSGNGSEAEVEALGERMIGDVKALQFAIDGYVDGDSASYVITAFVRGTMAYQITAFAGGVSAPEVRREANTIVDGFSFLGESRAADPDVKQVGAYESTAFAYRMDANEKLWFPWTDFEEDYPLADIGALGAKGYGAVVMPFCWSGERPNQLALLDVFMEQFGEDYPSPLISSE